MLYMAQITHSMGQKTQTEFYRRNVDKFYESENGTGYNMGALYWQLNDIWEGCSWSSFGNKLKSLQWLCYSPPIDELFRTEINGRWKMYAYFAQRAFSPVLASPYRDNNGDVAVEVISDSVRQYIGSVRVRIFKLSSLSPIVDEKISVTAVSYISIIFSSTIILMCKWCTNEELVFYNCYIIVGLPNIERKCSNWCEDNWNNGVPFRANGITMPSLHNNASTSRQFPIP